MRIVLIDTAYLGDLVLATPLVRAAAECASTGSIDVVTSPAGAMILGGSPLVNDLFTYDKRRSGRGLGGIGAARAWIRKRSPDVALLPRRSVRSMLLAILAGVPRRIGFSRGPGRWLLTDRISFAGSLHQVERNLELLRPLGVDPTTSGKQGHPLEVFHTAEERQRVDTWLQDRNLSAPGAFYAMSPGSVWATKRWPLDRYAATATALVDRKPVVVIGGPDEGEMVRRMIAEMPAGKRSAVHNAADIFTPAGTVHLLTRAAVLISNDSGALHMGQAAGARVVAIFGPTASGQGFAPRGEHHVLVEKQNLDCRPCGRHGAASCPQGHWKCMLEVPVSQVLDAVSEAEREAA